MRNRISNILIFLGLNVFFAMILFSITLFLFSEGLGGGYTPLFFYILVISLLLILNYFQSVVDSIISPISQNDLYSQTVDSVLNIEFFDEMLTETFDQVLKVINAKMGRLIFYYHDKNEFKVYYQKNKKKKVIRRAGIEKDNILLEGIKGPDDIIIKGKLDPLSKSDSEIIEVLEKLGGEIVIPIFYHETFFGLILIGERRRFTETEIRLLKIFASKIAILAQNSFYFSEMIKKKELEKEYELTSRLQKQFLPESSFQDGRINIQVHHKTASSITREFYDIYTDDTASGDVQISAFRIHGDVKETSILMPGVKALLQCYARLGLSPSESVSKLIKIGNERDVLNGDLTIIHSSLKQDGSFFCYNSNYPVPVIYRESSVSIQPMKSEKGTNRSFSEKVEAGDIIIIACKTFFDLIVDDINVYQDIIHSNYSLPLDEIKTVLINKIAGDVKEKEKKDDVLEEEDDKLLILVKMEDHP